MKFHFTGCADLKTNFSDLMNFSVFHFLSTFLSGRLIPTIPTIESAATYRSEVTAAKGG